MRTFLVLVLLLLQGVGGGAVAQPSAAVSAAREHYRKGTTLYDLSRYAEAAKEFELAYEAKPDPALLFNLAQAHRMAGAASAALKAYRSYLRRLPAAPNRAEVETRIAEVQEQIAASEAAASATPPTIVPVTPTPTPPTPLPTTAIASPSPTITATAAPALLRARTTKPRWVWGAIAGGVIAVGVGLGVGLGLGLTEPGARSPSIGVGVLQ